LEIGVKFGCHRTPNPEPLRGKIPCLATITSIKMNLSITDIISGLITAITTWVSGRFFTLFRQRQLYLVCHKPMKFPYGNSQSYKVIATVINKGKDKESNVKLSFPNVKKVEVIACSYESVQVDNHIVTIDRLLAGKEIDFVLLIASSYTYEQSFLPSITSDDTSGKTYKALTDVPPSGSAFVAGGMGVVFILCFLFLLPTISDKGKAMYSWYKYGDFNNKGFSLNKYTTMDSIDLFSFKNNDIPINLASFSYEDGYAIYDFYIKNNNLDNLLVSLSFEPRNQDAYYDELGRVQDKYFNTDRDKYRSLVSEITSRYFVDNSDVSIKVAPMQNSKLTIKRKIINGMNFDDMKIKINLRLETLKSYQGTDITFDSRKNDNVSHVLKDVFK